MASMTVKMGKRGTLVLPSKLRKQLGLIDGSLLTTEVKNGEIRIRPTYLYEPEVWSDQRRAFFLLYNSVTKEEWDEVLPEVLTLGIDPATIEGLPPNHRDTLPTNAELNERERKAVANFGREPLSA